MTTTTTTTAISLSLCQRHTLKLVQPEGSSYTCSYCKEKSFGERYSCSHKNCDFLVHKVCIDPLKRIEHPFFDKNVFNIDNNVRNCYCDACGRDIKGGSYHSICGTGRTCSFYGSDLFWESSKCPGHDLHPYCARTLPKNKEISKHHVKLILEKKLSAKCGLCGHITARSEKGERRKSWGYVSTNGKEHYHLYCVKNELIENAKRMNLRGESAMMSSFARRQREIQARNGHNRNRGEYSGGMRNIKLPLSLIISVLSGNPAPMLAPMLELLSPLFFD